MKCFWFWLEVSAGLGSPAEDRQGSCLQLETAAPGRECSAELAVPRAAGLAKGLPSAGKEDPQLCGRVGESLGSCRLAFPLPVPPYLLGRGPHPKASHTSRARRAWPVCRCTGVCHFHVNLVTLVSPGLLKRWCVMGAVSVPDSRLRTPPYALHIPGDKAHWHRRGGSLWGAPGHTG